MVLAAAGVVVGEWVSLWCFACFGCTVCVCARVVMFIEVKNAPPSNTLQSTSVLSAMTPPNVLEYLVGTLQSTPVEGEKKNTSNTK